MSMIQRMFRTLFLGLAAAILIPAATHAQVLVNNGPLVMAVDAPLLNATVAGPFIVSGWVLDQSAATGTGIDAVHVWAFPATGSPTFVGAAAMGDSRPDVGPA